ncbi:MAG: F0F1 ATP synthase subunit delta [Patescibacteria group bacterium]
MRFLRVQPRHYAILLRETGKISDFAQRDQRIRGIARLITRNHHRRWIPAILRALEQMELNDGERAVIQLTTTALLPKETLESLRLKLENAMNCTVVLRTRVKPHLIGGATFQVQDTLLDASLSQALTQLQTRLTPL